MGSSPSRVCYEYHTVAAQISLQWPRTRTKHSDDDLEDTTDNRITQIFLGNQIHQDWKRVKYQAKPVKATQPGTSAIQTYRLPQA